MSTYIIHHTYTDQGITNVKNSPKRLDAAKKLLKKMGCEMKVVYLTQGSYDLISVVEAPDDEAITRFVLALSSAG
ncbi:MAG: GYD domain-containing protein, partial [Burkholderiales bacterium]